MLDSFNFAEFAQKSGQFLDGIGIVVILGGVLLSSVAILFTLARRHEVQHVYRIYRQNLGRSILIGLEFLVAGDIIRSVAGNLDIDSVVILAIIVLIRSFLGIEFEMEIDGRWPWRRSQAKQSPKQ
ncbi:MAG: DUF1622 domain-containing protein [Candidatus Saccharimonadales bacterium]